MDDRFSGLRCRLGVRQRQPCSLRRLAQADALHAGPDEMTLLASVPSKTTAFECAPVLETKNLRCKLAP